MKFSYNTTETDYNLWCHKNGVNPESVLNNSFDYTKLCTVETSYDTYRTSVKGIYSQKVLEIDEYIRQDMSSHLATYVIEHVLKERNVHLKLLEKNHSILFENREGTQFVSFSFKNQPPFGLFTMLPKRACIEAEIVRGDAKPYYYVSPRTTDVKGIAAHELFHVKFVRFLGIGT